MVSAPDVLEVSLSAINRSKTLDNLAIGLSKKRGPLGLLTTVGLICLLLMIGSGSDFPAAASGTILAAGICASSILREIFIRWRIGRTGNRDDMD